MEVGDGQLEGLFPEAGDETGAHLVRGLDGEGEGEDALGRRAPQPAEVLADPVAHELGHGERLAGAGAREDPGGAVIQAYNGRLLCGRCPHPAHGSSSMCSGQMLMKAQRSQMSVLLGRAGISPASISATAAAACALNPSRPSEVSSSRSAGAP